MGRGSKAKKSQGHRFTEQIMPSKTPIVILTLNKALGSKSVRGHKHLKLTFGLSQGCFFVKSSPVQQSSGMEDLKHSGLPAAGDKWQVQSQSCEQRVPNSPLEQHFQGSSHYKPCFTDLHDSCLVWQGESGKPEGLWRTGPVFEPWQLLLLIKISLKRSCLKHPLFGTRASLKGARLRGGSQGGGESESCNSQVQL